MLDANMNGGARMKLSQIITLIGFVLLVSGCSKKPDASSSGESLYSYYCAECHKKSGDGKFLMKIPANRMTNMSRADVTTLIINGHSSKPHMKPIPDISYSEARKITEYLWTLKP